LPRCGALCCGEMAMSELTDQDRAAFAAVDDALHTYPLAPAPPALAPSVMARIHAPSATPHFRLEWLDYALSLFAAGMVGLGLVFWPSISFQLAADAQVQLVMLLQYPDIAVWVVTFLSGLVLAACALVLAALIFVQTSASRSHLVRSR
jgi:hypothetical protein